MPRRATSRTRITATSVPATRIFDDARMPEALRTTLQGAEALSTGLVHAVTETVVTAVRGVQEVGAELGTTALSAVRGSIRAAEEIGGDLGRLAMSAGSGAVDAGREVGGEVGRVAVGAVQGAAHAVQRAGVSAARMVGFSARRPLQKVERSRAERYPMAARRASSACRAGSSAPLGLMRANSSRSVFRQSGGLVASIAILPPTRITVTSERSTFGAEMSSGWMRSCGIVITSRSGFTRVEIAQKTSRGS